MKIKVCGLKYPENIQQISETKPDFMGFIFYKKSPRYCRSSLNKEQLSKLSQATNLVGVFVDEGTENILQTCSHFCLNHVQLHGKETAEQCKELQIAGLKVIKAFSIEKAFDFEILKKYQNYCDYFLFDTKTKLQGGSGKKFNWDLLNRYSLDTPFFLSGGIGIEDLEEIKKIKHPQLFGLDINSRFETEPGLKNHEKIKTFIKNIRDEY